jgi:predicted enzyme related to lactoylglutathione lyase
MNARFKHINIIAADWDALAKFYEEVFGCVRIPPESRISDPWLAKGTGVPGAGLRGLKLTLPGCDAGGPLLEIFQFDEEEQNPPAKANRHGFGHLAFEVEDVKGALKEVIAHGGADLGEVTTHTDARGAFTFVFATDSEGNALELTNWKSVLGSGHDISL